ncbi:OLC1v1016699C1 [Oldenlandia corymbosa var. corymbosa]|uniref:OLC1v1016699C1 n=1 Tax=Oldenlandia corymbosa var. corymbosa TaxID=529605 RepID=A0AAV1E7R1_OLDCO|nr:OLC1v1016699C1 [Oldenlandia corymbosa var. corymbosa]
MSVQLSSNPPVNGNEPPLHAAGNSPACSHPPPPPPARQNNRGPGRLKALGFLMFLVLVLVGSGAITYWVLDHFDAREPQILINSLSISSFHLNRSISQLTANWTVELLVKNVDGRHHIQYDSFNVSVFYGRGFKNRFFLAKAGNIASFRQNPRTQTKLVAEARGEKQSLDSRVASLIAQDQERNGSINFDLQVEVHVTSSQFDGDMIFTCSHLKVVPFPSSTVQPGTC